jgi:hypothetical protein
MNDTVLQLFPVFDGQPRTYVKHGHCHGRTMRAAGTAQPATRSTFTRARPRHVEGSRALALTLLRAVMDDGRFRELNPSEQVAIVRAIVFRADGDGVWFVKTGRWAEEAGVSRATVTRAMTTAAGSGLIIREPYLGPDGLQRATTYRLDQALVAAARRIVDEHPTIAGEPPDKVAQTDGQQGGAPVSHLNDMNEKPERSRSGEKSLEDQLLDELRVRHHGWPTGVRFCRGTHSATYVFDPLGFDQLPAYYNATGSGIHRPKRAEVVKALLKLHTEGRPIP